ncbi:MAG: M13 family metallopeptidase [Flavobacteriales bacterium]
MKKTSIFLSLIGAMVWTSCNNNSNPAPVKVVKKSQKEPAFDLNNLNKDVDPCTDFYQYSVGSWLKNNPVPETESRWGVFEALSEQNRIKINKIIDELISSNEYKVGSDEQLVRDFYLSALDTSKINERGLTPLKPYLEKIKSVSNKKDLKNYIIEAYKNNLGGVFSFWIGSDPKNSNENIIQFAQGGGGLPDRDYYLGSSPKMKQIRNAYKLHLQKMFLLVGNDEKSAKKSADIVFNFEKELAKISMDKIERRDPIKTYNLLTLDDLQKLSPEMNWKSFFNAFGIQNPNKVIVKQKDYMVGLSNLIKNTDLNTWKIFYEWSLINSMANYLPTEFTQQNFDFYSTTLTGVKTMKPRWKQAQKMLNSNFGESLGKLYVKKHFSEQAKKEVGQLIENLRIAFKSRINALDWMSDETKKAANKKLASFTYKIGYPDHWEDYSSVQIKENTLFENIIAVNAFSLNKMIEDYGKPVDKSKWWMNPQTINAYYNPLYNEVVFPAAILQPPFYNIDADDAVNYGSIGAVIGHEFTHGFDDKGCLYNHNGNLENWWQTNDSIAFYTKAEVLVEQFNNYKPLTDLSVNGKLTLGENIADFGGLTMAYYALENAIKGKGTPPQDIDGFTYKQRFFLGWANVWKNNIKEEALRYRILNDSHSPGEFRVNGTLVNMPEFQEAWGCKNGDSMIKEKEDRAKIW